VNTSIDGVIVQDFGMLYLLANYFKGLQIHASTQLTTHNEGQIHFLSKLAATRVNLSRELNIHEIKALTTVAHKNNISTEVFVHGSYCLSFSGICYFSSVQSGNSGNRGRCSQPCRDQYVTTAAVKDYPLNLKDNSAWFDFLELADAGVDAIKIEGRIKKFHYVYTVVNAWRKQLMLFQDQKNLITNNRALYKVFNRDFSNGFLKGDIHKDMFIDNPRDHSAIHVAEISGDTSAENIENAKGKIYDDRTDIITAVKKEISKLSIAKAPLTISISGQCGTPLKVSVKTPDNLFVVLSEINLVNVGVQAVNKEMILKRLKALNDTEYYIEHLELEDLQPNLYLPFKTLTFIKKSILFILNDSRDTIDPIHIPDLKKQSAEEIKPALSVLISDKKDLYLCHETSATVCFQLPDCFKDECAALTDLFPWFPSVLIGEDYLAAIEFLHQIQPKSIVTNNSGIAYEAFKRGIPWIAGPYLNIVNSYSLLCLKENFNCSGAFISNEISKAQIQRIAKPDNFKLYYSIYHPILLMTSRQCLFHQVMGCKKNSMDDACLRQCDKSASITNLKKNSFCINKTKGNYHRIYNETDFLNTDIIRNVQNLFSGFFIDVSDIKTATTMDGEKIKIIRLFENMLNGKPGSAEELKATIHPTTNKQYIKGI
jgi:putative protease